jgi:hypothetical protein
LKFLKLMTRSIFDFLKRLFQLSLTYFIDHLKLKLLAEIN